MAFSMCDCDKGTNSLNREANKLAGSLDYVIDVGKTVSLTEAHHVLIVLD
jgi:hypothetical protein